MPLPAMGLAQARRPPHRACGSAAPAETARGGRSPWELPLHPQPSPQRSRQAQSRARTPAHGTPQAQRKVALNFLRAVLPTLPPSLARPAEPHSPAEARPNRGTGARLIPPAGPRLNVPAEPHGCTWAGPGGTARCHGDGPAAAPAAPRAAAGGQQRARGGHRGLSGSSGLEPARPPRIMHSWAPRSEEGARQPTPAGPAAFPRASATRLVWTSLLCFGASYCIPLSWWIGGGCRPVRPPWPVTATVSMQGEKHVTLST